MSEGPMMSLGKATGVGLGLASPFVRGVLLGGAVAYVLTNENVQKAIFRGIARIVGAVQGGLEETKERYRDAEAELHAEGHKS